MRWKNVVNFRCGKLLLVRFVMVIGIRNGNEVKCTVTYFFTIIKI